MLENIEAVIFDLDGTLVDSMNIWGELDIEYLGRLGYEVPAGLQEAIEGMSFTETAQYFRKRFEIADSVEKIKEIWQEMAMDKYRHEVPLKPGVREFLDFLKERNIAMAVASSNHIALIKAVLESHDILAYFRCIFTACDVKKGKPAPDVYLAAARELGVEPEKCLVFEDIVPGILAGRNAGMRTCAVEDAYSIPQREEKRRLADYYINSYEEFVF